MNSLQTRGMQPPGTLKVHFIKMKGTLLFREKVPTLFPDWSILMQMRNQNTTILIVPNSMVLIGWNHAFWLVSVDANEDIATQFPLDGQISAHWSREDTGKSFITVGSDSKSTVRRPKVQSIAFPWNAVWVSGLCRVAARPSLGMCAQLTTSCPWKIYFFSRSTGADSSVKDFLNFKRVWIASPAFLFFTKQRLKVFL